MEYYYAFYDYESIKINNLGVDIKGRDTLMKIVYLIDFPLDSIGGAQKSTYTTISQMKKCGQEIILVSPPFVTKNNTELDNKNIYYYKKVNNRFDFFRKCFILLKCIKKEKPDVIHAQFSQFGFVLIILNYFRLIPKNIQCYFTDRHFMKAYNKKYKFVFKYCSSKLNKVICTTEKNKSCWEIVAPKTHTALLYNVLEPKWYIFNSSRKVALKKEYGFDGKFVVGFAGRMVDWKRWDTVVSICKELSSEDNIIVAVAISSPNDGNLYEDNIVEKYVENLKKIVGEKLISFINVDECTMETFYYLLDIFVLTSENESFGRTLIEAMSKKNVVIGTNSGGVPNVIGKRDNLYKVNDVKRAVELILKYKNNKQIFGKDTEYFFNRCMKEFNVESFAEKLIDIYVD